jgi:polyisoprenoid-binding protein YceI
MEPSRILAALALLAPAIAAAPVEFRIAPAPANQLQLEVDKTGLMKGKTHVFVFHRYAGKLWWDETAPAASKVELTIESGSIECKDTWVSEKDRAKILREAQDNMLATGRFPQIRFVSDKVAQQPGGQLLVDGQLTLRDQTHPVTLTVTPKTGARFEGEAVVKLTAFGLKPPAAALGAIGTRDEMRFRFTVTAAQ